MATLEKWVTGHKSSSGLTRFLLLSSRRGHLCVCGSSRRCGGMWANSGYILEVESSGAIPRSRQTISCCFRQDKVFMPDVGQHTGFLIENILLFSIFFVVNSHAGLNSLFHRGPVTIGPWATLSVVGYQCLLFPW